MRGSEAMVCQLRVRAGKEGWCVDWEATGLSGACHGVAGLSLSTGRMGGVQLLTLGWGPPGDLGWMGTSVGPKSIESTL